MKIGIISDTHIPVRTAHLPEKVFDVFNGVDKIFHAGDIEDLRVLDELEAIAPVTAVAGNMDYISARLQLKRTMTLDGVKIGLMHGAGGPRNQIREFLRKQFDAPDIIIYGHTHQAFWAKEAGIMYMNPGSPTDSVNTSFRSVGLLTIEDSRISGKIIRL